MTEIVLPLIIFLFPLAYSPGPGNLSFAANGARFGLRATIPASLGYHVATFVVSVAIGYGAWVVLDTAPQVFRALQVVFMFFGSLGGWRGPKFCHPPCNHAPQTSKMA